MAIQYVLTHRKVQTDEWLWTDTGVFSDVVVFHVDMDCLDDFEFAPGEDWDQTEFYRTALTWCAEYCRENWRSHIRSPCMVEFHFMSSITAMLFKLTMSEFSSRNSL